MIPHRQLNIENLDDGYVMVHYHNARYGTPHHRHLYVDDIFSARVDDSMIIIATTNGEIIVAKPIEIHNAQQQLFEVRLEGTPCTPMLRVLGTDRVIPIPDHVDLSDIGSYVVSTSMQVLHRSRVTTIC